MSEEKIIQDKKKKSRVGIVVLVIIIIVAIVVAGIFFYQNRKQEQQKATLALELQKQEQLKSMTLTNRMNAVQIGDTKEQVKNIFEFMETQLVSNTDGKLVESFKKGESASPQYIEIVFTNGVVTDKIYH